MSFLSPVRPDPADDSRRAGQPGDREGADQEWSQLQPGRLGTS